MKQRCIRASGNTAGSVDKGLAKQVKDLTDSLKRKGFEDVNLQPTSTHFIGEYSIKAKSEKNACVTQFKVESDESWRALEDRAKRAANGEKLRNYDATLRAEQYYELTDAQEKALARPKPASYTPARETSPLSDLYNR